ncbi:hypothetical protein MMC17_000357 [Xylographa soralifera]|nr:hypothetical protein [Xylographa soralifera]
MVNRLIKCKSLFPHVERIRVLFEDLIRSRVFKPSHRCAALFNEVAWWYRLERAYDDEASNYASLSLEILNQISKQEIEKSEELNKMLSESHQYRAVSLIFTDTPGSLAEVQAVIDLVIDRIKRWNREEDAIQLAESYNVNGMALTRIKEDDRAIQSWWRSYEAFGNITNGNKLLRQEWPAIHLAIIHSLRNEAKKGEKILLPVLKAREEAFGKDDKISMV